MQQAELSLAHSTQLQEKGFVTPEQVRSDEFGVENARAELESAKLTLSVLAKEMEFARHHEKTKTDREIRVFQAREQAAKSFLEQLNAAAISNQQIRRLDEEIEVKRREQGLLSEQKFEL